MPPVVCPGFGMAFIKFEGSPLQGLEAEGALAPAMVQCTGKIHEMDEGAGPCHSLASRGGGSGPGGVEGAVNPCVCCMSMHQEAFSELRQC